MKRWTLAAAAFNLRHSPDHVSPFETRTEVRPLRLLIDGELDNGEAATLLAHLSDHPQLELLSLGRSGRHTHVDVESVADSDDWVAVVERSGHMTRTIVPSVSLRGVAAAMAKRGGAVPADPQQIFVGLMGARLADRLYVDVYVTEQSWLGDAARGMRCVAVDVVDALALVGAYLRRQGDYRLRLYDMNSARLFDRILVHVLLPRHDEWEILEHSERAQLQNPLELGLCDGLLDRLAQALRARDWLLGAVLAGDDSDDVLMYLDMFLLTLHAAFDAVALLTDRALGWDTHPLQRISWSGTWRSQLPEDLRRTFGEPLPEPPLAILSTLRNTVHAPNLNAVGRQSSAWSTETLVTVPELRSAKLIDRLQQVGVEPVDLGSGELAFRPGDIVEYLLPSVFDLIDRLLAALAQHTVWAAPPSTPAPWQYDRRSEARLLGGVRPLNRHRGQLRAQG